MKKAISILLAFVFLLSTLGISIGINYCPMKKSYSFSVIKKEKSCCCQSSNKKNCCKSQKIELKKIGDNYVPSDFQFKTVTSQLDFILYQNDNLIKEIYAPAKETILFTDWQSPVPPIPLSILYRSILI